MRKILVILIGLLLPAFCFGAVSYERTPGGYTIQNPVSFSVSVDDFSDFGCEANSNFWKFDTAGDISQTFGDCLASSTLSYFENFNLPLDIYYIADIYCYNSLENCDTNTSETGLYFLEYNDDDPIFEVVAGEEVGGGLFTFPSDFVPQTGDTVKDYIFDLYPFLALIVGTLLFFWIVSWTLDKISSKK